MKHEDDDDTQVYADTLLIVYQRGFSDGKKAAERKPLTEEEIERICASLGFAQVSPVEVARAIEQAHEIKEGTCAK